MGKGEGVGLLGAVRQTLRHPDGLPYVLRELLDGVDVYWQARRCDGVRYLAADDRAVLRLRDPAGGVLTVVRDGHRFTVGDRFAVHLLRLFACRPVVVSPPRRTVHLACGTPVRLRAATPRDLPVVTALHTRCAPRSAGGAGDLAGLPHPRTGRGLLAEAADGEVVGWAALTWDGRQADLVLMAVEAWRDRGLLGALLRESVTAAEADGCETLWLHGDVAVRRAVEEAGLSWTAETEAGGTVHRVRLGARRTVAPGE
ncbi:GNAT family N-acetyltransferase [Streptomyces acidiscabies]|uniref:GNAT family N-acetyltransferase n=1 Tax=Streptomyces acidiscabies TaxID=42234 RepID=UPI000B10D13B|nr:GNAT family N-acetyltransferase [Streptomyces acidiscabies]